MSFESQLSIIDVLIIAASLLLAISVGLWAGRNQDKTARGYFLASGRLPWYIIGSAFVSTSVSSEQMVGTVGMAYDNGMGVANWEWFTVPHYLIFIVFFGPDVSAEQDHHDPRFPHAALRPPVRQHL